MELNENLVKILAVMKEFDDLKLFPEISSLSKTEYLILREVVVETRNGNHIISSELARRIGVTRSAISQIVTKLEQANLLRRTAAPDDKKIAYIELSDHARELFNRECGQANDVMDGVVKIFGKKKMNDFMKTCEEFIQLAAELKEQEKSN